MSYFKHEQLVLDTASVSKGGVVHLGDTFKERLLKAAEADNDWQITKRAVFAQDPKVLPQFQVHGEFLLYDNQWMIPQNMELRIAIMKENHDSTVAGHFGQHKTYERIMMMQNFF